ncbi:MAG: NADPH-dependent reductase [Firmicutes bacterium]|nr:NADPH-dependent reductase [Bacillota bacterium]
MMKVLGLVASPRKLGNSEILVKAMMSFLPDTVEKEMIRLTDLDIKTCKACYSCLPEERNCILKDDLGFLFEKLKAADAVIIASPCYALGPHTSIKMIGDRLLSVLANSKDYANKKCITAIVYGVPGWEGYAREAVNNFARFFHLDVVGSMIAQAAIPGEVIRQDVMAEAQSLALKLIQPATVDNSSVTEALICQDCGSSVLQFSPSGSIRCVMCNAHGTMQTTKDGYRLSFTPRSHSRFSPAGSEEHGQLLQSLKSKYIATQQELSEKRKPYSKDDWWVKIEP